MLQSQTEHTSQRWLCSLTHTHFATAPGYWQGCSFQHPQFHFGGLCLNHLWFLPCCCCLTEVLTCCCLLQGVAMIFAKGWSCQSVQLLQFCKMDDIDFQPRLLALCQSTVLENREQKILNLVHPSGLKHVLNASTFLYSPISQRNYL